MKSMTDIIGYEGIYTIDTSGNIYSNYRHKHLQPSVDKHGYPYVILTKDRKKKSWKIHRLLCLHFKPNPENKPCVNHIDGGKQNNSLYNLEWCTYSENSTHAIKLGLRSTPKGENHYSYGKPTWNKGSDKRKIKVCGFCGEDYKTYQAKQMTCSISCGQKLRQLKTKHFDK